MHISLYWVHESINLAQSLSVVSDSIVGRSGFLTLDMPDLCREALPFEVLYSLLATRPFVALVVHIVDP